MRRIWLAVVLLVAAAAGPANAPEPSGFWTGPLQGNVPATISGGRLIHTEALAALLKRGGVLLVDVSPTPRKPSGLAPNAPWMPLPHKDIPGSAWLADVGGGALTPAADDWYRTRLAALSHGRLDLPLVVYCHPHCWASWNAAKRAIGYGYRDVRWYPDGIEGWQEAGLPTGAAEALSPPSSSSPPSQ